MRTFLIWNGSEFLTVPDSEAMDLVRADKAQIVYPGMNGLLLKTKAQFSSAEVNPPAPEVVPPDPTPEPEEEEPEEETVTARSLRRKKRRERNG